MPSHNRSLFVALTTAGIALLCMLAAAVYLIGPNYSVALMLAFRSGTRMVVQVRADTIGQSVRVIEKRLRESGVMAQVRPRPGSAGEIEIKMSGAEDPSRVKGALGAPGGEFAIAEVRQGPFDDWNAALAALGGVVPPDAKLLRSMVRSPPKRRFYVLVANPVVTSRDLRDARALADETGRWNLAVTLSGEAGQRFGHFTETHLGSQFAIVFGDEILSVPVIQSRITDRVRIMGLSQMEAESVAFVLRTGAIPGGAELLDESVLKPSWFK